MPGSTKHPLYGTWKAIVARCENKRYPGWPKYGGRGIRICEEWKKSFSAFVSYIQNHLGEKPSKSHTLDRVDNDGDYQPGNIRWATKLQQNLNRRETLRDETGLLIYEIAKNNGVNPTLARDRFSRKGWDSKRAATEKHGHLKYSKVIRTEVVYNKRGNPTGTRRIHLSCGCVITKAASKVRKSMACPNGHAANERTNRAKKLGVN